MPNLTDDQVLALNDWSRTQPTLRREFDYTSSQGVPGATSDGLGDRLNAANPGSDDELATLEKQVDFTDSDATVYQGFAEPGALTSQAVWRITKTTFTSNSPNSDDVEVRFADSNSDFDNVWDDRASLSYS
jgi:hypothetical protein